MTNLADAGRSTTFRWTLSIAAALLLQAAAVSGFFWWQTARHALRMIDTGLSRTCDQFTDLPPDRLPGSIDDENAEDTHRNTYVGLFDAAGRRISGNILSLPPMLRDLAPRRPVNVDLQRSEPREAQPNPSRAIRCSSRIGLLVIGRDLDEQTYVVRLTENAIVFIALPATVLALGLGFLLSLEGQRRFSRVGAAIESVLSGQIDTRLPARHSADPFDRLCRDVNRMLDYLSDVTTDLRCLGDELAHELRTPLTRLRARLERGSAQMLSGDEARHMSEASIREIDQALGIISAILRIRTIDTSLRQTAFTRVDLTEIVSDAIDLYRPIAEDREIRLEACLRPPAFIHADRDLMMEAIANLIDNSLKFTAPGGHVSVEIRFADKGLVLSVRDNGPGIAPEDAEHVTSKFVRGRSPYQTDGQGIGLSLVKAIAKLHGFLLTIDPMDRGCQMSIRCPPEAVGPSFAA